MSKKESLKRVKYAISAENKVLGITYGSEGVELKLDDDLRPVVTQLILMGLTTYLQRASTKVPEAEKIAAIESAYDKLVRDGMEAFAKSPVITSRGPKKADRIAALAMLKGVTPDAVKQALAKKPQADQDRILNAPAVLAKVAELQGAQTELDL